MTDVRRICVGNLDIHWGSFEIKCHLSDFNLHNIARTAEKWGENNITRSGRINA